MEGPEAAATTVETPETTTATAAETTAAAVANLDGKIIRYSACLRRGAWTDQRRGLHRRSRRSEGHEPRNCEETEQSLHLQNPSSILLDQSPTTTDYVSPQLGG
jgi:hypothetical protein